METPAIPRRLAFTAGAQQLINWGISLYARHLCRGDVGRYRLVIPTNLLRPDARHAGDGHPLAVCRPAAVACWRATRGDGRLLLLAVGCLLMADAHSLVAWYSAWLLTGIGMRLSLYDALFAALVNLYGKQARRTISRITLTGGLASVVFWPLGRLCSRP